MCGIAGVYIKDPAAVKDHPGFERFCDQLFLGIEGRGKHATGFVAVARNGKVTMDKADVAASVFIKDREPMPHDPWYALLHTRWATKGDVKNYLNNHPVLHGTCFTTHNGSIDNDDELFAEHGFQRSAEVDTEILPALVGTTDFDPTRIRDTFKDVDGSCAMATIDPVNQLGKVLLLRTTEKSPLYLIDTPKYVIWASTQLAIKEAWGKVLGTPPKHSKFKFIPAWRFVILEQEMGEVETYDLIPRPAKSVQTTSHWAGQYGHGAQVKDNVVGDWVSPHVLKMREEARKDEKKKQSTFVDNRSGTVLITADEVRTRVRAMRLKELGRARTWTQKGRCEPGTKWFHCNVCRDMVHEDSFETTLTRGKMCEDCADTYTVIYQERNLKDEGDPLPPDEREFDGLMEIMHKTFPGDMRDKLNKWGEDEAQVHTQVMEFLSDGLGIDIPVLEYMMDRVSLKTIEEDHPELLPLIEKLWEEYETEYESLWGELDPSGIGAFSKVLKSGKSPSPGISTQRTGTQRIPHFSNGNAIKRVNNCLFCRKKPKVRLIMADRAEFDFNYCNQHHTKCSTKGCNEHANHTRKDGMRVCHVHARSTKECYADRWLDLNGYSLESV